LLETVRPMSAPQQLPFLQQNNAVSKYSVSDVKRIVGNKRYMFLGDSNMRGVYKDFVACFQGKSLVTEREMKLKGEKSFRGDKLLKLSNVGFGVNFEEVRMYQSKTDKDKTQMQFHFITRCWNNSIKAKLSNVLNSYHPDVIIMNSCLWDITRYHHDEDEATEDYMSNLFSLVEFLQSRFKGILLWYTWFLLR